LRLGWNIFAIFSADGTLPLAMLDGWWRSTHGNIHSAMGRRWPQRKRLVVQVRGFLQNKWRTQYGASCATWGVTVDHEHDYKLSVVKRLPHH